MKILVLGAANNIHIVKWVNGLVYKGHDVYLAFNSNHRQGVHHIDDRVKQFELKFSGIFGYLVNSIKLSRIFITVKPDVVNVHYVSGYGTLARFARLKPLVSSVWGADIYEAPYRNFINYKTIKDNLIYSKYITSTSNNMVEPIKKLMGRSEKEVIVVPFGVDCDKFLYGNQNKKYADSGEKIVIGIIKALEPKYGMSYLVKAFRLLVSKFEQEGFNNISDNLYLHIYGDGSEKELLEKYIKENNLEKKVKMFGKIPNSEVPKALSNMNIFCATSIKDSESFGVAVIEAMAVGLPVVVSDVAGFKEVVEDNISGIIVPRENIEAIKNALERLVLNAEMRVSLGENGRKRVEDSYNWARNLEQMLDVYQRAI